MRNNYPELLTNLSVCKLRTQLMHKLQIIYKCRDKQGRRIFIFRAGKSVNHMKDIEFTTELEFLFRTMEPKCTVSGRHISL